MTATTTGIMTDFEGLYPARVTLGVADEENILKGTIVCLDASGYAVEGALNEGLDAVGKASATADNRSTAPFGGTAGGIKVEVEVGIFVWAYSGTAPKVGDVVYVLDNQTVIVDSNGGTRGIAGIVTKVGQVTGYVSVFMGPHVAGMIRSKGASGQINIPLGALRLSTGAAVPAFADGSADGFALVDSEALGLRINDDSTTTFACSVAMPQDLDSSKDLVLHVLGFRVGAADTTAALTVGVFFQTVGAAHTADADAGGATSAFDGATTVVTEETLTIAAADVPASPSNLTLTLTPTAALDGDDLVILSAWLEYVKA